MPIVPNMWERLLFLKLNLGPGPLLDIFGGIAFQTVLAAVNLGVFDTLSGGPLMAAEIARQTKTDQRGITVLLEALEALGYVAKKGNQYANTAMAAKWLVRSSPTSVASGYDFWGKALSEFGGTVEESILRGRPATPFYQWIEHQPETLQHFQSWLMAAGRITADAFIAKVKLPPTARRLLDVGGGHGLYSIKFCQRYPHLSATVFDLPGALEVARQTIADAGIGARVSVQAGDFLVDELGTGYDVALLFNIVHGLLPEQNVGLLSKVAGALNPDGGVIIMEQLAGRVPGPAAKAVNRLLGLAFFYTLGGQIYTFDQVAGWLTAAGFIRLRRINLLKSPGISLVLGTKV